MSSSNQRKILYEEKWMPKWVPLVLYLPCFYTYGIQIEKYIDGDGDGDYDGANLPQKSLNINNERTILTFGYGLRGPGGWTAHEVKLCDIKPNTIVSGNATWKDNLFRFGGWGIRVGKGHNEGKITWAYIASNGGFIEFEDVKGTCYRFGTRDADTVFNILNQTETS